MLLLWMACGPASPTGEVGWAVDYATVSVDLGSIEGQHVWVFYSDAWGRDRDAGYHECSLLQSVSGEETTDTWEGCEGCIATYEVVVEDLTHDCSDRLVSDPAYTGVLGFAIGEVPDDLVDDAPYEDALGWYIAYETGRVIPQGYAWAEGVEYGREVQDGWVDDQVYTLWPAYAWELGE